MQAQAVEAVLRGIMNSRACLSANAHYAAFMCLRHVACSGLQLLLPSRSRGP
jgi:hypothetical protein